MSIRAILPAGQTQITVNGLHQWDYGRKLEIVADDLPSIIEVHFACAGMTEAVIRTCGTIDGVAVAAIPDQCLEQTTPITAWVYAVGDTSGSTEKTITMPIIARTKPPMTTVPEGISDKYTEALAAFNDAVDGLRDGNLVALEAAHAIEADHATEADHAENADNADHAILADTATTATTAGRATNADKADHAKSADQASHADQATYAERFAHTAVVPRAEVAALAEGVVDEIDGEQVYVPRALWADDANTANTAQSATCDKNMSTIHLTYPYNPIRKTFTNTNLSAPVQLGAFNGNHDFSKITTLTLKVELPGTLGDNTCVFIGDVYGAGAGTGSGTGSGTMYMTALQLSWQDQNTFHQNTIGLKGNLYLDDSRRLYFNPQDMYIRKYTSNEDTTDNDTWMRVDRSAAYIKSCVISFA